MEILVRAQPQLQQNLLDFFEQLPANRLGSWVCRGWIARSRTQQPLSAIVA